MSINIAQRLSQGLIYLFQIEKFVAHFLNDIVQFGVALLRQGANLLLILELDGLLLVILGEDIFFVFQEADLLV